MLRNRASRTLALLAIILLAIITNNAEAVEEDRSALTNDDMIAALLGNDSGIILAEITGVTDSLSIGTVGVVDTHQVGFNTTSASLSDSAIIWVTLPAGFAIGPINDTSYSDNDSSNDLNEPVIRSVTIDGQTIKFQLNQGAQQAVAGSRISVRFAAVTNNTVAGDYAISVATTDADGNIDNGPGISSPFTLAPDILDLISVLPDTALIAPSDTIINFAAAGYDQYSNLISGIEFSYALTVDSCGVLSENTFRALKVGECYFTASFGGLIDSSGLITVVPGALGSFAITGYPAQTDAGDPFITPVIVTAYDVNDNIKTDYIGSIWFTSDDPDASLPHESGSPYTFIIGDSGSHSFTGPGFVLRRSGLKTITVTDGTISETSNSINVLPDVIASFVLTAGLEQTAGVSFTLQASDAFDSLGNLASGEVIVADSVGGGSSPDGIPPLLNRIIVANGSGSSFQTLTNATPTVLKGTVSGTSAVAATDIIEVYPGNLGRFEMAGYPDSTTAGASFPDPGVSVSVFDLFGNPKTNYVDSIYFTISDPLASLPYIESSRYNFIIADSGSHTFPGGGFELFTAGHQLLSVTDGSISDISSNIYVTPGAINSFIVFAPDSVTAGIPFSVTAANCRDLWDNLTNGTINVVDSVGGENSPDGSPPIYNAIRVTDGSGIANQTLVNTETTVLKGYSGTVVDVTDSIYVLPSTTERFDLSISSPQVSGMPFSGTADLTAIDFFGNIKTDYDAALDTVVISSSAGGVMQNNIIDLSGDFVDGLVDLVALSTTYTGRGGDMTFSALSQSGAVGVSGQVDIRAIFCAGLVIDQGVLSWGDTATGVISVVNDGGVAVEITDLDVFSESGMALNPGTIIPTLPDSVGPGINRNYNITIPIHGGMTQGVHPLSAAVSGLFGSNSVSDSLAGFPDTLEIQAASSIEYIDGSISRDTLSTEAIYSLTIRLSNTGDAGLGLIDSSYLYFTDGTNEFISAIQSGVYLPPNTPLGVDIWLDSTQVAVDSGDYPAKFYYYGQENGHFISDSLNLTDLITIQNSADIAYIAGSINIDTLVAGQPAAFNIGITNSGTASFIVDHLNTLFRFSDSQREFVSYSDTSFGIRVDIINPGDTTLYFASSTLSQEFSAGRYLPAITIRGEQNGITQTVSFDTSPDSIDIISRGSLRIDSTYVMSINAPFVNTLQPCSARVVVFNAGDEQVDSVYVRLTTDGSSVFPESLLFGDIGEHSFSSLNYPIVSAVDPDSGEIFVSSIYGGAGHISGFAPLIQAPLDNAALLIVETAAQLSLSPVTASWPPGAEDDSVTVGQNITISTTVLNLGQAGITGTQRVILDTTNSGFSVIDSLTRDFEIDQEVSWNIIAPSVPDNSAILAVRFAGFPHDVNDDSEAVGPDSVSTIEFYIDTTPTIAHIPVINQPSGASDGIISANQMFTVTNTLQPFGDFYDLSSTILLPYGYTTDDSITRYPSGNTVSWNIRAPENVFIDSIALVSSLFDINTGEIQTAGPDYIRIETVDASNLELGTRIAGPGAALDGIIEPGSYVNIEAVVNNVGQAAVGTGRLSLHIGHPDMYTTDEISIPFAAGTPILWTINAPPEEISTAVPIWVSLDSIPDDENTNAAAHVINDSSSILISVRELLPRLEFVSLNIHSGSVVKGQRLQYLSFMLRNNDRGGSFIIGVTRMNIGLKWNPRENTQSPIVAASLFSDSTLVSTAEIFSTHINFDITDTLLIDPGMVHSLMLRLEISTTSAASDFSLSIESGDIGGVIIDEGIVIGEIFARSIADTPLWNSPPVAILEQSFAGSVSSYPNPFNPRNRPARIGYYLDSDSDLSIKIYTLLGELVWSKDIGAADPLGRAGLHTGDTAVIWNGKNSSGYDVHTGVYICLIENVSAGQEEKLKIAVIK